MLEEGGYMGIIARLMCGAVVVSTALWAAEIGPVGKVVVVRAPEGGGPVEAKITAGGTIHLLYDSGDIPYYVKSSDHGASFSAPIAAVEQASRRPGLVFAAMDMAVSADGTVHVAMMSNNWKTKLPGVPDGLVYATLAPGARAFQPVRSLNRRPSEGFSLAADGAGDVAATWLSGKLYANFSRDGGKSFTPNTELNPAYDPCECCTTRAVYGANGDLAVLYREKAGNQRDIYLVVMGKDGSQSRTRVSSTLWNVNACPMTYFALSATGDSYLAAWPTKGDIYFARLDRNGRVLAPGEVKTPGRSGMRSGVVALGAPDGATLIAWKHDEELGWQVYDREGRAQGAMGTARGTGKGAAGVVDERGRFILFP
jgi:hypothetical protein